MTQTNMPDKNTRKPNRIPVRFEDEAQAGRGDEERPAVEAGGVAPEDVGRESSYEDETEVKRRIDRGSEQGGEAGRAEADESDAAGGPVSPVLPPRAAVAPREKIF